MHSWDMTAWILCHCTQGRQMSLSRPCYHLLSGRRHLNIWKPPQKAIPNLLWTSWQDLQTYLQTLPLELTRTNITSRPSSGRLSTQHMTDTFDSCPICCKEKPQVQKMTALLRCYTRSKAIGFRRPFPLVSVSLDGISPPKVYAYRDVILSTNTTFLPSALSLINEQPAYKFVESLSQLGALNDPDALYNSMFFSPGFAAETAGWQGMYVFLFVA